MKTIAQINWTAAIIVSIIVVALIAYFLRHRHKEFIYLFSFLAALVTMVWFTQWGWIVKTLITIGYITLLFACLLFDSIETPEDSLLNKDKPDWFDKNHLRAS